MLSRRLPTVTRDSNYQEARTASHRIHILRMLADSTSTSTSTSPNPRGYFTGTGFHVFRPHRLEPRTLQDVPRETFVRAFVVNFNRIRVVHTSSFWFYTGFNLNAQVQSYRHRYSLTSATTKTQVFSLHNIVAERPDELNAKAGDSISVVSQSSREWFVAKSIGCLDKTDLITVSFVSSRFGIPHGKAYP